DLALSRVCLAQAQLLKPERHQDPAAASAAMRPVLTLPPQQRIAGLRRPLSGIQAHLDREPIRHAAEARQLRAEISELLTGTRARLSNLSKLATALSPAGGTTPMALIGRRQPNCPGCCASSTVSSRHRIPCRRTNR